MSRNPPLEGKDVEEYMERWRIKDSLRRDESMARARYRELVVQGLVVRIVDSMKLVRADDGYSPEFALRMIEKECTRLRMVDDELGHDQACPLKSGYAYET